MNKELLEKIKSYIEEMEMRCEWEWGDCRKLEELIEQDKMPEIYYKVCELLK